MTDLQAELLLNETVSLMRFSAEQSLGIELSVAANKVILDCIDFNVVAAHEMKTKWAELARIVNEVIHD